MIKLFLGEMMKIDRMAMSLIIALLSFSTSLYAADSDAGKAKSAICAACHGSEGISKIDGYPNLRGQNEKYLLSALKSYKNNLRKGGNSAIMQIQASILDDEDIANLAAYYSSLK